MEGILVHNVDSTMQHNKNIQLDCKYSISLDFMGAFMVQLIIPIMKKVDRVLI